MFQRSIKSTLTRTGIRNICWMKNNNGIYTIGFFNKDINNINNIIISKKNYLRFNEKLFTLRSNKLTQYINAPFDCKILERNNNILGNLYQDNFFFEKDIWVVKIEPSITITPVVIVLPECLDNLLNNEYYTPDITEVYI